MTTQQVAEDIYSPHNLYLIIDMYGGHQVGYISHSMQVERK